MNLHLIEAHRMVPEVTGGVDRWRCFASIRFARIAIHVFFFHPTGILHSSLREPPSQTQRKLTTFITSSVPAADMVITIPDSVPEQLGTTASQPWEVESAVTHSQHRKAEKLWRSDCATESESQDSLLPVDQRLCTTSVPGRSSSGRTLLQSRPSLIQLGSKGCTVVDSDSEDDPPVEHSDEDGLSPSHIRPTEFTFAQSPRPTHSEATPDGAPPLTPNTTKRSSTHSQWHEQAQKGIRKCSLSSASKYMLAGLEREVHEMHDRLSAIWGPQGSGPDKSFRVSRRPGETITKLAKASTEYRLEFMERCLKGFAEMVAKVQDRIKPQRRVVIAVDRLDCGNSNARVTALLQARIDIWDFVRCLEGDGSE